MGDYSFLFFFSLPVNIPLILIEKRDKAGDALLFEECSRGQGVCTCFFYVMNAENPTQRRDGVGVQTKGHREPSESV